MGAAEALGAGAARLLFYPTLLYTAVRARLPGTRRPWFHRIDGAVLLGALPLRGRSRTLVEEENVRAVVTLNEEYETRFLCCSAQEWAAMGVEQLRLSTVDLTGVPTLENLHKGVEFILRHRACGNSVYVHCKAGRSRSATMVAAYLIQFGPENHSREVDAQTPDQWCWFAECGKCRANQNAVQDQGRELWFSEFFSRPNWLHGWSPQEAIEAIAKIRPHILVRHKQVQVLETFHRSVIAGTAAEHQ